jgi:hypothetical protein
MQPINMQAVAAEDIHTRELTRVRMEGGMKKANRRPVDMQAMAAEAIHTMNGVWIQQISEKTGCSLGFLFLSELVRLADAPKCIKKYAGYSSARKFFSF